MHHQKNVIHIMEQKQTFHSQVWTAIFFDAYMAQSFSSLQLITRRHWFSNFKGSLPCKCTCTKRQPKVKLLLILHKTAAFSHTTQQSVLITLSWRTPASYFTHTQPEVKLLLILHKTAALSQTIQQSAVITLSWLTLASYFTHLQPKVSLLLISHKPATF